MSTADDPAYPGDDEAADDAPEPEMGLAARVVLAAVMVAVVLVIILHLTGTVGPAAH